MRIIAGSARGRKLVSPTGLTTRPILDSLKERLFNILGPDGHGTVVWDLFAGVGSLGLECLSRGAESCFFVERDRQSAAALARNIEVLGFGSRAVLSRGDATAPTTWARAADPDLVFLDPPFPLVEGRPRVIADLLATLAGEHLTAEGRVVLRTPLSVGWSPPAGLLVERDRREHGVNALHVLVREGPR